MTLFEKSESLGGTLRFASVVYEPNERLLHWLERQVEALGVDIRLGQTVTPDLVASLDAQHVIVATGARRERLPIDGADLPHVFDGDDLRALLTGDDEDGAAASKLSLVGRIAVTAGRAIGATREPSRLRELSRRYMPMGQRVVVVGGGLVGIELAEFLTERKRTVTVLEAGPVLGEQMAHPRRWRELHGLREAGATLLTNARAVTIDKAAVHWVAGGDDSGETHSIPVDSVVLATGLQADSTLADALRGAGLEPIVVGDCTGVGYIEGAILDGFEAATKLGA